ncbi:V-type proton ATPase subunit H [Cucumispora dikerogammari]|nr:V-type proton ATPase subunit H [Cucumispora dikerogammari]
MIQTKKDLTMKIERGNTNVKEESEIKNINNESLSKKNSKKRHILHGSHLPIRNFNSPLSSTNVDKRHDTVSDTDINIPIRTSQTSFGHSINHFSAESISVEDSINTEHTLSESITSLLASPSLPNPSTLQTYYLKHSYTICHTIITTRNNNNLPMSEITPLESQLYDEFFNQRHTPYIKGIILEILAKAYHHSVPPNQFWKFIYKVFSNSNLVTQENVLNIILPIFCNENKKFTVTKTANIIKNEGVEPLNKPEHYPLSNTSNNNNMMEKNTESRQFLTLFKPIIRKFFLSHKYFSSVLISILLTSRNKYNTLFFLYTLSFTPEALKTKYFEILNTLIELLKTELQIKDLRLILKILLNYQLTGLFKEFNLNQLYFLIKELEKHLKQIESVYDYNNSNIEIVNDIKIFLKEFKTLETNKLTFKTYMEDLKHPFLISELHFNKKFWNTNIKNFDIFKYEILTKFIEILNMSFIVSEYGSELDKDSVSVVLSDLIMLLSINELKEDIVNICNELGFKEVLLKIYYYNKDKGNSTGLENIEVKIEVIKVLNLFLTVSWNMSVE